MTQMEAQKHLRPDGVDDATVEAVGAVSEALEYVERARGELYAFHQLMGHADLLLGEACDKLRDAGHAEMADRLEEEVVGRNVLYGRWTFQIVRISTITTGRCFASTSGRSATNCNTASGMCSKRK
jgi:hypothetical protein